MPIKKLHDDSVDLFGFWKVELDTDHHEVPEPETIFMVPVGNWSDGAPAAVPIIR